MTLLWDCVIVHLKVILDYIVITGLQAQNSLSSRKPWEYFLLELLGVSDCLTATGKKTINSGQERRCSFDFHCEVGRNVGAVKWFDNKFVHIISSYNKVAEYPTLMWN